VFPLYKSFSCFTLPPTVRITIVSLETRHLFAFHMNTLLRNNRELKQARRRRQQEPHKLAYLKMKHCQYFCRLCTCIFQFLCISQLSSSFWRRNEMMCFAVVWTTWALDQKFSILSFLRSADLNQGACFSTVRKAISKTPTRLFFKASLLRCCKGNKN